MELVDSFLNPPIQRINGLIINGLTKNQLQSLCDEVTIHINRYDRIIRQQLEKTMKNYKLCIELCEEKLDLLRTYKEYETILATLPSEKENQEMDDEMIYQMILDTVYETILVEKENQENEYETVLATLSDRKERPSKMVSERDPHE